MQLWLAYKNSIINYYTFGCGNELLVAFHGYGEDGNTFRILEKSLGSRFTIIAIDFPFHGKTIWREALVCTPESLMNILQNITRLAFQPFHLLGYSMGGRVSLLMLQQFPKQIKSIALIAPDGLHINIWHTIATQTIIGNKAFHFTMKHPDWLFLLMKVATALQLFNKSVYNFADYYLKQRASRLLLYKRWTTMRKFNPAMASLKNLIAIHQIPVKMLFGKYDKIILTQNGFVFQKGIKQLVTVKEIEAGHQLLKEKYLTEIAELCST
jgi:pimeloyl-ACP methyl ester carboxylesterase